MISLVAPPRPTVLASSLSLVCKTHSLRCDAKQAEPHFAAFDKAMESRDTFLLGDFLPRPVVKGIQPKYLETLEPDGIPVISTMAIQDLQIRKDACRFISREDSVTIDSERHPKLGDVLLTVDGGPSIGKPAVFNFDEEFAVDSHVAILRPRDMNPYYLAYLLASPLGQIQFKRAESGASGQTSVSEDDIRRFRFPNLSPERVQLAVEAFDDARQKVEAARAEVYDLQEAAWGRFYDTILEPT